MQQVFELKGSEFIPLDKLLKIVNIASSGGEAHAMIVDGYIKVNGAVELQKRKKLRNGDHITFEDQIILIK